MQNLYQTKKDNLSSLFHRNTEKALVNQIIGANVFMTAEDWRPIKIKGLDIFSTHPNKLEDLLWNRVIELKKLYIDENNCIVSEVFLEGKPIKELLKK